MISERLPHLLRTRARWHLPHQSLAARLSSSAATQQDLPLTSMSDFRYFTPLQMRPKDFSDGTLDLAFPPSSMGVAFYRFVKTHCPGVSLDRGRDDGGPGLDFLANNKFSFPRRLFYEASGGVCLVGLGVERVGKSSVIKRVGLFAPLVQGNPIPGLDWERGHLVSTSDSDLAESFTAQTVLGHFDPEAFCVGRFSSVYVDPVSQRPVAQLPQEMRTQLEKIMV